MYGLAIQDMLSKLLTIPANEKQRPPLPYPAHISESYV